ncbi:hypothetical protein H1F29_004314, partial [Salmonella enterica]|nr:hypothetical protein [Salmonella enterica]
MWRVFCLELRVAFRHGADIAGPLWFFLMVITLFPLSVGPQPQLLARIAPGIIQVAALLASLLALVISGSARATTDVMPFKDEAQEQQFRQLTEQLRCPKCQNNSIADSNAMIATDMRRRVYDLMQEGKSRQEIIDYMVARYGNFVTYDPPLTPLTVLLWVLPLAAIVAGGWIIVARTRRRVRLR